MANRWGSAGLVIGLMAAGPAVACEIPKGADRQSVDFAPILSDCIHATPKGGTVELPSGAYTLKSQLIIDQPVTLKTRSSSGAPVDCKANASTCAILNISPEIPVANEGLPIWVTSENVSFDGIAVKGFLNKDAQLSEKLCRDRSKKRFAGGVRVDANKFSITRSSITEVSCYSALEVIGLKSNFIATNNFIGRNGNHTEKRYADGITLRDVADAKVENNTFYDNTDVQLILGGCRKCSIRGNQFTHSRDKRGASLAELMVQAWPHTSGRYDGTAVQNNTIDCGPAKLCGFGLMIGSAPWYKAPAAGGTITNNTISNARVGINIDGATGMIDVRDNTVTNSGGQFDSRCGVINWPAVNVAPDSKQFIVDQKSVPATQGVNSAGCLIETF